MSALNGAKKRWDRFDSCRGDQPHKGFRRWRDAFVTISALCALLAGCGGGGGGGSPTPASSAPVNRSTPYYDFTKFTVCATSACAGDLVNQFHVEDWFWTTQTVYDEPFLPVAGTTAYKMWRPVVEIQTVRSITTGTVYVPGRDYQLANGQLTIPAGSTIPTVPATFTSTPLPNTPAVYDPVDKSGNPLRVSDDYQQNQIAVTYTTTAYEAAPPLVSSVPYNTMAKLKAGQRVAITVVGDSLGVGADSTRYLGLQPSQPGFIDLVIADLSMRFPGQVYVRNQSVVGETSGVAAANASSIADVASDLVIVEEGMNDQATGVAGAQFQQNLQTIIGGARWVNPNCDVLLVSSWPSNPNWALTNNSLFVAYNAAMYQLAGTMNGVSVADMTSVAWSGLFNQKSFFDLTGNGVNHPNDFMYVVYAQTVLKTILGM